MHSFLSTNESILYLADIVFQQCTFLLCGRHHLAHSSGKDTPTNDSNDVREYKKYQPIMEETTKLQMTRILLAYTGTFVLQVFAQKVCFFRAVAHHKKVKAATSRNLLQSYSKSQPPQVPSFDMRSDPICYPGERCVGNYLEWTPMFLTLIVLDALVGEGEGLWSGWIVVFARCVYPLLAVYGNAITKKGADPKIFVATCPMYLVYIYLFFKVWAKL